MSLNMKLLAAFAATAAFTTLAAAPAQAGTVVASSGPSASTYAVGTQISNTQRITLRQGDSLTVLDNGGTRVLRGPGTFILARQSGRTRNNAFTQLTQRTASRARTGAVRNTQSGQEVRNPNLWYVNVAAPGTVCLTDNSKVLFWRADTIAEAVYSISADGGSAIRITFPEKEMLAELVSEAGLATGVEYSVSGPSLEQATAINFVFLESEPTGPEEMAKALIENNCTGQLEQLSAALAE